MSSSDEFLDLGTFGSIIDVDHIGVRCALPHCSECTKIKSSVNMKIVREGESMIVVQECYLHLARQKNIQISRKDLLIDVGVLAKVKLVDGEAVQWLKVANDGLVALGSRWIRWGSQCYCHTDGRKDNGSDLHMEAEKLKQTRMREGRRVVAMEEEKGESRRK